jgi:hypothetical protein
MYKNGVLYRSSPAIGVGPNVEDIKFTFVVVRVFDE